MSNIAIITAILFAFTIVQCATEESEHLVIFGARCEARCRFAKISSQACTGLCYAACMKPCANHTNFFKVKSCKSYCGHYLKQDRNRACRSSCKFLLRLYNTGDKSGTCGVSVSDSSDSSICQLDTDCPKLLKCCRSASNKKSTCQTPVLTGYPSTPTSVKSFAGKKAKIEWSHNHNGSIAIQQSTVFIIESRYISVESSGVNTGNWMYLNKTNLQAIAARPRPGFWVEYRVLAVNEEGTSDYSSHSTAVYTPPERPSRPQDFRVVDTKAVNDKVFLHLAWRKPQKSDLPINRYRLFWSPRLDKHTDELISLRVHHAKINADRNFYIVSALKLNTTYVFELQAICRFKGKRLRSKRVYLTTRTIGKVFADEPAIIKKKAKVFRNTNKKLKPTQSGQATKSHLISTMHDKKTRTGSIKVLAVKDGKPSSTTITRSCLFTVIWLQLIAHITNLR